MLKNILKLNGTQQLSKKRQKEIKGAGRFSGTLCTIEQCSLPQCSRFFTVEECFGDKTNSIIFKKIKSC